MDYDFDEDKKYNKFYTALLSIVPGAGHMYLGLMKKGLQFMFIFFGAIIVTDLIYSARSLTILNIVIWFYAFFDAYHTRKKLEAGKKVDGDLFSELRLDSAKPKYVGVSLITIGIIVLIQQVLIKMLSLGIIIIPPYAKTAIIDSIFPILLVVIGIIVLINSRNRNDSLEDDFDSEE